jgi:hypothetical protein
MAAKPTLEGLVKTQLTATRDEVHANLDALGLNHVAVGREQGDWTHPASFVYAGPGDARILEEQRAGVRIWQVPVAVTVAVLDPEGSADDTAVGKAEAVAEHLAGQGLGEAHKTKPVGLSVGGAGQENPSAWETLAACHLQYQVKVART